MHIPEGKVPPTPQNEVGCVRRVVGNSTAWLSLGVPCPRESKALHHRLPMNSLLLAVTYRPERIRGCGQDSNAGAFFPTSTIDR